MLKIFNKNYQSYLLLRLRKYLGCKSCKDKSNYSAKFLARTISYHYGEKLLALVTDIIVLGDDYYIVTPRVAKLMGRNKSHIPTIEREIQGKLRFIKDDFSFNYLKSKWLME